jgi:hypothetical protein
MSKIKDLHKDYVYRQTVFKEVFNNEKGKLVIEYLKALYDTNGNPDNSNLTFFMLGKRAAIKEIETLVNSEIKKEKTSN